jgi:hypothetical protein
MNLGFVRWAFNRQRQTQRLMITLPRFSSKIAMDDLFDSRNKEHGSRIVHPEAPCFPGRASIGLAAHFRLFHQRRTALVCQDVLHVGSWRALRLSKGP